MSVTPGQAMSARLEGLGRPASATVLRPTRTGTRRKILATFRTPIAEYTRFEAAHPISEKLHNRFQSSRTTLRR